MERDRRFKCGILEFVSLPSSVSGFLRFCGNYGATVRRGTKCGGVGALSPAIRALDFPSHSPISTL